MHTYNLYYVVRETYLFVKNHYLYGIDYNIIVTDYAVQAKHCTVIRLHPTNLRDPSQLTTDNNLDCCCL